MFDLRILDSSLTFFLKFDFCSCSAASDVDPGQTASQGTGEPARGSGDAAPQTTEQPTAAVAPGSTEGLPSAAPTTTSSPTRAGEAPPTDSSEKGRSPTAPPAGGSEVPPPPRAGASSAAGSPGLVQGPVIPGTTTGGDAAQEEETRAASDDEVEEIEGRPRDGRQHVYVWRQRGDHFIGHEELAETEEAARVERAAKRLVDEVKVSGFLYCCAFFCLVLHGRYMLAL